MRIILPMMFSLLLAQAAPADETVQYARDIKPIFKERCFSCHGALKQKAGLRLDTAALMRQGGDTGPALEPGRAEQSLILQRVTAKEKRMPPLSEGEPLSAGQIALIKVWIEQGAKGPANETKEADPRQHWAFRPPLRPPLPAVKNPAWQGNPIDAFLAAEHDKLGLVPLASAPKHVLLRRVYFDLIGLPPTRAELRAFLADPSPVAYEKVVDRLLSSPHYGERWGRHWMDVWRYSDWYGRRSVKDVRNSAPQIWRWRDWIIASLNHDHGYDRMVREMLAADEIAPEDDAAQAATGYIVRNWYALNPNQWMRDMVEHTGKAFLGLTFNCAHCHDHKYDPITHEDYFRLRAFFEPVQLRQDRVPGEGDPGLFEKYDYTKSRQMVKLGLVRVFDENHSAKTFMYRQGDERLRMEGKPPVTPGVPAFLGKVRIEPVTLPAVASYPGLRPFVQHEDLATAAKEVAAALTLVEKVKALIPADDHAKSGLALAEARKIAAATELQAIRARAAADNAKYKKAAASFEELARAASKGERQAALMKARVQSLQADQDLSAARKKAEAAPAGKDKDQLALALKKAQAQAAAQKKAVEQADQAMATVNDKYTPFSPQYPAASTGRRRALALWLTSTDNPLTARVAVNHLWLRHFDRALVETVFDFGRNGKKPSHPELLDWLAVEFMTPTSPPFAKGGIQGGWSMKHLHRLIVTSQAYRLSSGPSKDHPNLVRDADNRYLWRFISHRLEAEIVRDALLYAAGQLDKTLGGPVLENDQEATSQRRSLYFSVYPEDGGHLRFLEIFDAPDPCDCYRRDTSVMPQQALALTNNTLVLNQSRFLARKLWDAVERDHKDDAPREAAFLTTAFEQVLCRQPTTEEQDLCRNFLAKQMELYRQTKWPPSPKGNAGPSSDPAMRARESLMRALFNHNDFVTVR